jgi:hypothetical protein
MTFPFNSSRRLRHAEVISRSSEYMPYKKLKQHFLFRLLPLILLSTATLTGCGIYNGGFQRGGELTSSFLERIQETEKDQEDYLIEKKETKSCSK